MRTVTDIKNVVLIRSAPARPFKVSYPLKLTFSQVPKGWVPPKDCQRGCFNKLKGEKFRIINMPTGSGKTIEVCCLCAYGLMKEQFDRAIVAVPQDVIASGFVDELVLKLPGCPEYEWDVPNNLCDISETQVISKIIGFLEAPPEEPILVCTHAALVRAFEVLKVQRKEHLLQRAHLFIDEAHHIQNAETEQGIPIKNQLGVLATHAVQHDVGLTMTTATYARGDRSDILTESQYSQFRRYDYPFDEYFATLQIEYLSYDFALYDGLHHKAVARLVKDGLISKDSRVIFYVPKTGQAASLGNKTDDVEAIRGELWRSWRCLDLVHEDGRDARKQQLIDDPTLDVNAVFAMNMMEEGANWRRADTAVVIGPRYSLPGIIQKLGRLMRDYPGKKRIRLIHLLPFTFDQSKEDRYRSDLNDWLKESCAR
jgi:superfamily II DNA or RNA helicase